MTYRDELQRRDLLNDWLQVNWEVLVESSICKPGTFLETYGEGGDCNNESDRVRFSLKEPDSFIGVIPKSLGKIYDHISNEMINLDQMSFYKFIAQDGDSYSQAPPFDFALLEDLEGNFYSLKVSEIDFILKPSALAETYN